MDDVDSPCLRVGIMAAVKRAQCRVGGVPASRAAGGARQGRAGPQRQRQASHLAGAQRLERAFKLTLVGRVDEG